MVQAMKGSFEVEIETAGQADSIVDALDEQERKKLFDALNKKMGAKKEVKETIEKTPELEDRNFRVEDTSGWKEITDQNGVKVKENPEGDVSEYLEGEYKGEQLFTQDSALREANKARKTLPYSWTTYRDIINQKYEGAYQDFLKGENISFPGRRHAYYSREFCDMGQGFGLRCADGSSFNGSRDTGGGSTGGRGHGFSVRCFKNPI